MRIPGRRTSWPAYAAIGWAAVYTLLGLYWWAGGAWFPFGTGDPRAADDGALLAGATAPVLGPVTVALGLAGVAAGWAMSRRVRRPRPVLLVFGWTLAALLAVVLPESRAIKYLPPLGFIAFFRPPDPPTLNFLVLLVGGLVWAAATLGYARATRGACAACGHGPGRRHGAGAPGAWAVRWGRPVTYLAIAAPWVYAASRIGWAFGVPIGVPAEFLDTINANNPGHGTMIMELVLAGLAIGGSILTVGLIRPWGEIFPRWIPWLAGRRVPPAFPVGCAGLVSVGVTAFGLSMSRGLPEFFAGGMVVDGYQMNPLWALPPLAFLVWGPALALAALAYDARHPARCWDPAHAAGPRGLVLKTRANP
ncbi:hypothetical protein Sru01_58690 [Sphaerisporangium rufum]|uniref:DUF3995 domain-containing protein n=1 Tax=Sphaerisporangium rufum TaxID=1381558 RepID=A0A919RBF1_9ACTN|nr:hypothetical protein [Sphaerisporangium rufum]GII80887.1 hypothetical protein Sru01_58690 [Sphaerisporangium rufum]